MLPNSQVSRPGLGLRSPGVAGGQARYSSEDIARAAELVAAPRTRRLPDGTIGYYMRRRDDCLRAAIATCLQIPYEEVADSRIDEQLALGRDPQLIERRAWEALRAWSRRRDLRLVRHELRTATTWHPYSPCELERWIGVILWPGQFQGHTLVMSGREELFDVGSLIGTRTILSCYPKAFGGRMRWNVIATARAINAGVSFTRR